MSSLGFRPGRSLLKIAAVCVLAAAGPAFAGEAAGETAPSVAAAPLELAGRWEGTSYELGRKLASCEDGRCTLLLDIVKCPTGWCGIEVGETSRCGATALRLDGGTAGNGNMQFKGKLELAKGTEPYVVEAYLYAEDGDAGSKTVLQINGDTGGEFRVFRRSFPFNASLARIGDAKCKVDGAVSLLD